MIELTPMIAENHSMWLTSIVDYRNIIVLLRGGYRPVAVFDSRF